MALPSTKYHFRLAPRFVVLLDFLFTTLLVFVVLRCLFMQFAFWRELLALVYEREKDTGISTMNRYHGDVAQQQQLNFLNSLDTSA